MFSDTSAVAPVPVIPIGNIPPMKADERSYIMLSTSAIAAWLEPISLRQTARGSVGPKAPGVRRSRLRRRRRYPSQ